ncbi:MAG TPA: glycosyltransferase [Burkholderiaceae bacterium]|nr:glycosyltransferase [Burkholderiaceae bacterium]
MRSVVLVQRRLVDYRVPLFEAMRQELRASGIDFRLLVGEPHASERSRCDTARIDWAVRLATQYTLGGRVCWQPFGKAAGEADLVIVTQENKLLYNFVAMTARRPQRLAFWGHGRNMQSERPDTLRERFKRAVSLRADWWFAYTSGTAKILRDAGFPESRITVLENATDTRQLRDELAAVTDDDVARVRAQFGLTPGATGLYLGSLYDHKRLDFLVDAARIVRDRVPQFCLLVVGDGPDRQKMQAASAMNPWIKFVGHATGARRAQLLRAADVCLNPGATGLAILDVFCAGLPYLTTDVSSHGPEIEYLAQGRNGLMTANDLASYAGAVVGAIGDPRSRDAMRAGALETAEHFTIENMTRRFCAGILQCLSAGGSSIPSGERGAKEHEPGLSRGQAVSHH